jgi:hypothetical protein
MIEKGNVCGDRWIETHKKRETDVGTLVFLNEPECARRKRE